MSFAIEYINAGVTSFQHYVICSDPVSQFNEIVPWFKILVNVNKF